MRSDGARGKQTKNEKKTVPLPKLSGHTNTPGHMHTASPPDNGSLFLFSKG